jgi:TRAP-type C4-dicarboxylate transport system permease small subunit
LRVKGSALAFLSSVASLMFVAVFSIFMLKVVLRYAFSIQLAWADEVCAILFVWIIFWANAFLVTDRQQIAFDLAVRVLPPGGRRIAAILRNLIIGGLFATALPGSISYIMFLWREHTPVLQLRLDYVYSCFGIFLVAVCVRAVLGLWRLRRAAA